MVDALDLGSSAFGREGSSPSYPTLLFTKNMRELSEIVQELVENSNSMNQVDSKTAIQYVVEAYESGMDKARNLIKNSEDSY